ncbi:hypothetical protein Pfo_025879 [Paulownia fortunei]|nr:hypothetical protein Pfo_025879 [Paulownia fortunei]
MLTSFHACDIRIVCSTFLKLKLFNLPFNLGVFTAYLPLFTGFITPDPDEIKGTFFGLLGWSRCSFESKITEQTELNTHDSTPYKNKTIQHNTVWVTDFSSLKSEYLFTFLIEHARTSSISTAKWGAHQRPVV